MIKTIEVPNGYKDYGLQSVSKKIDENNNLIKCMKEKSLCES